MELSIEIITEHIECVTLTRHGMEENNSITVGSEELSKSRKFQNLSTNSRTLHKNVIQAYIFEQVDAFSMILIEMTLSSYSEVIGDDNLTQ